MTKMKGLNKQLLVWEKAKFILNVNMYFENLSTLILWANLGESELYISSVSQSCAKQKLELEFGKPIL